MRVQHVWAKTGTSPVAFHNTTRDVALCPASERRPVRVFRQDQRPQCGHIERARPTLAPPYSPGPLGQRYPGPPAVPPPCVPPPPGGGIPGRSTPPFRHPTAPP